MKITYIGHAGFVVDIGEESVLCDPWMSPTGAFAGSWFQWPANDHIDPDSLERVTHMYVSHHHRDHFDEWFLKGRSKEFRERVQLVIARYPYGDLLGMLQECGYTNIAEVHQGNVFTTARGTELFMQREMNPLHQDSAVTFHKDGITFTNTNDCKLITHQEDDIAARYGSVDVLAMQFSGATFHPTSYAYPHEELLKLCRFRRATKERRVLEAADRLGARYYIPSAGPPCFLDDELFHLNRNEATIFPGYDDFETFARRWRKGKNVPFRTLAPGDAVHLPDGEIERSSDLVERALSLDYIREYQARRREALAAELDRYRRPIGSIVSDAKDHFQELLERVPELADLTAAALRVRLTGEAGGELIVDLAAHRVNGEVSSGARQIFDLELSTFWMRAIVDGLISWEDFLLSFRFRVTREPDYHNEALLAYLIIEQPERRHEFVLHRHRMEEQSERVRREIDGKIVEYDRFCPHNGEDLVEARISKGMLVCPRHGWQFSTEDGQGLNNPCTIHLSWPDPA
jgi:UDP-MurNAc hydroxylase